MAVLSSQTRVSGDSRRGRDDGNGVGARRRGLGAHLSGHSERPAGQAVGSVPGVIGTIISREIPGDTRFIFSSLSRIAYENKNRGRPVAEHDLSWVAVRG